MRNRHFWRPFGSHILSEHKSVIFIQNHPKYPIFVVIFSSKSPFLYEKRFLWSHFNGHFWGFFVDRFSDWLLVILMKNQHFLKNIFRQFRVIFNQFWKPPYIQYFSFEKTDLRIESFLFGKQWKFIQKYIELSGRLMFSY